MSRMNTTMIIPMTMATTTEVERKEHSLAKYHFGDGCKNNCIGFGCRWHWYIVRSRNCRCWRGSIAYP
ncbi:MAG: hypothetical protein H7320_19610 [Ferruginibacter sp.]|nr:hypothetical protein [Ferruginibacter sp.]